MGKCSCTLHLQARKSAGKIFFRTPLLLFVTIHYLIIYAVNTELPNITSLLLNWTQNEYMTLWTKY